MCPPSRPGARAVTNGSEWIVAYDPATGYELWRTTGVRSNAIHTPLVGEGLVIATAGFPERRVIAIRPGATPKSGADRVAWTYDKGTAYVVSPILYKGLVYLLNDRGVITTLEAKTGKVVYEGGRIPKPATFMGSPVAFGDHVLLTSEDGETFFVKAGATHEIARTNSVDEPVYSTLALDREYLTVSSCSAGLQSRDSAPHVRLKARPNGRARTRRESAESYCGDDVGTAPPSRGRRAALARSHAA